MRIKCKITSKLPFSPHRVVVNIIQLLLQESFVETGLGVKAFGKHPVALPLGSFSFAHRIIQLLQQGIFLLLFQSFNDLVSKEAFGVPYYCIQGFAAL